MARVSELWSWLLDPAFTVGGTSPTRLEVVAFVTGAWCVWLTARQRALNWPIGIVNSAAFLVLFVTSGLFADSALQVVYIALGLFGWWEWVYGGPRRTELPVTRTTRREWVGLALAGALATAGLWWLLGVHTASTVPLPDAMTTVLSLAATWGQCMKKVESWWIWITVDVLYIPLYAYKGLWLTAALYLVFLALCVGGLRAWRRAVGSPVDAGAVARVAVA